MHPAQQSAAGTIPAGPAGAGIVVVTDLWKAYPGRPAVRGLDLVVRRGEAIGLVGPNGAGKSSTIRCLLGLMRPDAGRIEYSFDRRDPRESIGYVPQETGVYNLLSVRENISLVAEVKGCPPTEVERLIELFGLQSIAGRYAGKLSGGQRRLLHIALAFVGSPELVVLDEPMTSLDVQARAAVLAILRQASAAGTALLMITHDLDEAEELLDRIVVMVAGRVIADEEPGVLLARHGSSRALVHLGGPAGRTPEGAVRIDGSTFELTSPDPAGLLNRITEWLRRNPEVQLVRLDLDRPRLAGVLTGLALSSPQIAPDPLPARAGQHPPGPGRPDRPPRRPLLTGLRQALVMATYEGRILLRERLFILLLFVIPTLLIVLAESSPDTGHGRLDSAVPRFAVGFAFTVTNYTGTAFFRDTWWNSWQRTRTLPLTTPALVLGRTAPAFTAGCVQLLILLGGGYLLGGTPAPDAKATVALFILLTVLAAAALGVVLSSIARTTSEMSQLSYLFVVVGGALAGAFTPDGAVPAWSRPLRLALPQYWAITGLEQLDAHGSFTQALPALGMLSLMVLVLVAAGLRLFKLDQVSSR